MSDRQFERAVIDWLEDGIDRMPERAIDGVPPRAMARISQRWMA